MQSLGFGVAKYPSQPSKRKLSTGGEKRHARNSLPQTVFVICHDSRGSHATALHGIIELIEVNQLATTQQHACIEQQRLMWVEHTRQSDFVVWTVREAKSWNAVLLEPGALPRVKGVDFVQDTKTVAKARLHFKCQTKKAMRLPSMVADKAVRNDFQYLLTPAHYKDDMGLASACSGVKNFDVDAAFPERAHIQDAEVTDMVVDRIMPHRGGCCSFTFHPDVLLHTWLLQRQLKSDSTPVERIVKLAMRVALPPHAYTELEHRLKTGMVSLPKRSKLQVLGHKLFALDLLHERHLLRTSSTSRHWMPDSTLKAGVSIFACCEFKVTYPKTSAFAAISMPTKSEFSLMPLFVHGYGQTGVVSKTLSLHHYANLIGGDAKGFDQVRWEVRTYCSDQGDENEVLSSRVYDDRVCDYEDVKAHLKLKRPSASICAMFFLPLAMGFVDCLHICFNAFESAVSSHRDWKPIEQALTAIVGFLSDAGLRGRCCEVCMRAESRLLLKEWSIHHGYNWKWEYMQKFTTALLFVLESLQADFDAVVFKGTKEWNNIHAKLIDAFDDALHFQFVLGIVIALDAVCLGLKVFVDWFDGCWDHQFILDSREPESWKERVKKWRQASHDCIWRGRRIVEMVSGSLEVNLDRLKRTSSPRLSEHLAKCSNAERAYIKAFMIPILEMVVSEIADKLSYIFHVPVLFLGALSHKYAGCTIEHSRSLVTKAFAEVDDAMRNGLGHRLHRVCFHLAVGADNACHLELREFQRGSADLGPIAESELKHYALAKVVTRRVESQHSRMKHYSQKKLHVNLHGCNVALKSPEIEVKLEEMPYFTFMRNNLNKRCIYKDLLKFCVPDKMRWRIQYQATQRERHDMIHLSSTQLQYRNITREQQSAEEWKKLASDQIKPQTPAIMPMTWLLVDYMKEMFTASGHGVVYSMPTVQFKLSEQAALPSADKLMRQIVDAFSSDAKPDPQHHTFFRIVDATQETQKSMLPAHLERSRTMCRVSTLRYIGSMDGVIKIDGSMGERCCLDLVYQCAPERIGNIVRWETSMLGTQATASQSLLRNIYSTEAMATPLSDRSDDALNDPLALIVDVPSKRQGPVHDAERIMQEMISTDAVVGGSSYRAMDMSTTIASVMQSDGVLVVDDVSEEGRSLVRLDPAAVDWHLMLYLRNPSQLLRCSSEGSNNKTQRNKLELVCQLLLGGWEPSDTPAAEYILGATRTFSMKSFQKPASLLLCLLKADWIFSKGALKICMEQSDGYYKCLLRLEDLKWLHARPDFDRLSHERFLALSKGLKVAIVSHDVKLAIPCPEPLAIMDVDAVPEPAPAALMPEADSFRIKPVVLDGIRVWFDNYTGSGGQRRALCLCRHCTGVTGRCEKDVQLRHYNDDPIQAAAFLIAWNELGLLCDGDKTMHMATDPDEVHVAGVLARLLR